MSNEMTLRDQLAAAALPALIERNEIAGEAELRNDEEPKPEDTRAGWNEPDQWEFVARSAYAIADAMLKARA